VPDTDTTTRTGRYTVGSFRDLEAQDAPVYLEQQIAVLQRTSVIRCVYRQGADYPEHFHPQEQVTVVVEGALELTIAGEHLVVRQGQVVSIEPEVRHSTRVAPGFSRAIAYNLFVPKAGANGTGIRTFRSATPRPATPHPGA
jgi:quercetin dioxygenase-like cupin family protein